MAQKRGNRNCQNLGKAVSFLFLDESEGKV